MDQALTNSPGLFLLILVGAFLTTFVQHFFIYLTDRTQTLSLIFAVWIFFGFHHHVLDLGRFVDAWNFQGRTQIVDVLILIESYFSTLFLLHLLYGTLRRYQWVLIPWIIGTIILGFLLPEAKQVLHLATRFLLFIAKLYLLYQIWTTKRAGFGLVISGSLIYTTAILFFGSGPISMRLDYPVFSQIVIIISFVLSINLYSVFLGRLASLATIRLTEIEITTRHLKELDQMKMRFFSNITHEFRTPLTLIQGPAQILENKASDEESRELLGIIRKNTQRLLSLINQLLDLAKLDEREMKLQPKAVQLDILVRTMYAQFQSMAATKGVSLRLQLPPTLPVVLADIDKLESIIMNLLSNAIKFTNQDGFVSLNTDYDNGRLLLRVADSGRGMDPLMLDRVFDRFYQIIPSDSNHSEGSGIGLALVKEYTQLMQGFIRVESQPGVGTVFEVDIPLPETSDVTEYLINQLHEIPAEEISSAKTGDHQTIMLVEDNEDIRKYIRHCLGKGYQYLEATDGKSGVKMALDAVPHLVICDWMMPGMDGIGFCKELKGDRRTDHIPIIMVTAKAQRENKLEGLLSGADDYLVKPFDRDELVLKVENLLDGRENLRALLRRTQLTAPVPIQAVSMEERFISSARSYVERHLTDENMSVETLAAEMVLSREQLYRKMRALTGLSPSGFIRTIRLRRAKALLEAGKATVSEVAYEVGLENLSHFTKAFKAEFGVLPSEVLAR